MWKRVDSAVEPRVDSRSNIKSYLAPLYPEVSFFPLLPLAFHNVSLSLSPPNYPRQFPSSISPHPPLPYIPLPPFSLSIFFSFLRTLPHRSRDRSVKPHTLGIEYIKVPSFFQLRLYHALFRLSVSLPFLSLSPFLPFRHALTFDRRTLIATASLATSFAVAGS